jgi:hypothetical protein
MTLKTGSGKSLLPRQEVSLDRNLLENGAYSMLHVSFVKTYFFEACLIASAPAIPHRANLQAGIQTATDSRREHSQRLNRLQCRGDWR